MVVFGRYLRETFSCVRVSCFVLPVHGFIRQFFLEILFLELAVALV